MNGILLIDKPSDWTSHDVIAKLRGLLKLRRIGHAGTLDPMATGLLTVFVGRATRAVAFAEAQQKTYITRLKLGVTTDTQDTTGRVLTTSDQAVSRAELEAILPQFLGEISQTPPMYSAIKVDGQRLYKLARKGVEVERAARSVTIQRLAILGQSADGFELEVTCSKGTYIRTLCHDMGQALGVGGTMAYLRRTQVGAFSIADACTLQDVQAAEERSQFLLGLDTLFAGHPAYTLDDRQVCGLRNGQALPLVDGNLGLVRVYSQDGQFLALGEIVRRPEGRFLATIKSFFEPI